MSQETDINLPALATAAESRINTLASGSASATAKSFGASLSIFSNDLVDSPAANPIVEVRKSEGTELVVRGTEIIREAVLSKEVIDKTTMMVHLASLIEIFQLTCLDHITTMMKVPKSLEKKFKGIPRFISALSEEEFTLRQPMKELPRQFTFSWTGAQKSYIEDHPDLMPVLNIFGEALDEMEISRTTYITLLSLKRKRNEDFYPKLERSDVLKPDEPADPVSGISPHESNAVHKLVDVTKNQFEV